MCKSWWSQLSSNLNDNNFFLNQRSNEKKTKQNKMEGTFRVIGMFFSFIIAEMHTPDA